MLVDAAHEQLLLRFPEAIRRVQPTLHAMQRQQLEMLRNQIVTGSVDPATIPVHPALPEQAAAEWRTVITSSAKVVDAMLAELDAVEQGHAEMRAAGDGRLGSIPLVVLSHGRPIAAFPPQLGVTEQDATAYERTWQELQAELAALSTHGRRVLAEQSGHMIHHDQPDLVVNAIRDVIEQAPT